MKNTEGYDRIKPKKLEDTEDASAVRSSKGRRLQNMVLIKKDKTGGGAGPSTPTQRNGRWAASEVSREHNVYVTTKVDITPGADDPTEHITGYHKFLSALKERN